MDLAEKFAASVSRRKFFDSLALATGAVLLLAGLSGPKSEVGKKGKRSRSTPRLSSYWECCIYVHSLKQMWRSSGCENSSIERTGMGMASRPAMN